MQRARGIPISVGVIFSNTHSIKPVWFTWEGRHYHIKQITFSWHTREGVNTLRHFSVTDGSDNYFEICFHPSSVSWYLSTVQASE